MVYTVVLHLGIPGRLGCMPVIYIRDSSMKKLFVVSWALLLFSFGVDASQPNSVKICTPEWEFYTQKDGAGLYHELWAAVFKSAGINVDVKYVPFKRCVKSFSNTKTNDYDAYAGGYGKEGDIIPHWHIGVDLLTVAYKKGEIEKWTGEAMLKGQRVGWERGFEYDKYGVVNVKVQLKEFTKLKSGMQMLASDRIDFLLDYSTAIKKTVAELGLTDQIVVASDVMPGPKYYMIFSDTEKGRALSKIWDAGMERLNKAGQLNKMYSAYEDKAY